MRLKMLSLKLLIETLPVLLVVWNCMGNNWIQLIMLLLVILLLLGIIIMMLVVPLMMGMLMELLLGTLLGIMMRPGMMMLVNWCWNYLRLNHLAN